QAVGGGEVVEVGTEVLLTLAGADALIGDVEVGRCVGELVQRLVVEVGREGGTGELQRAREGLQVSSGAAGWGRIAVVGLAGAAGDGQRGKCYAGDSGEETAREHSASHLLLPL